MFFSHSRLLIGMTICSIYVASIATEVMDMRHPHTPEVQGRTVGAIEGRTTDIMLIAQEGRQRKWQVRCPGRNHRQGWKLFFDSKKRTKAFFWQILAGPLRLWENMHKINQKLLILANKGQLTCFFSAVFCIKCREHLGQFSIFMVFTMATVSRGNFGYFFNLLFLVIGIHYWHQTLHSCCSKNFVGRK